MLEIKYELGSLLQSEECCLWIVCSRQILHWKFVYPHLPNKERGEHGFLKWGMLQVCNQKQQHQMTPLHCCLPSKMEQKFDRVNKKASGKCWSADTAKLIMGQQSLQWKVQPYIARYFTTIHWQLCVSQRDRTQAKHGTELTQICRTCPPEYVSSMQGGRGCSCWCTLKAILEQQIIFNIERAVTWKPFGVRHAKQNIHQTRA